MDKKILIIDNDPDILKLLKKSIQQKGITVYAMESAKGVLDICKEYRIDLVITDIVMPDVDGMELIFSLRERFPQIPIIAISGGGKIDKSVYLDMANASEVSATFEKPMELDRLLNKIDALIWPSGNHF